LEEPVPLTTIRSHATTLLLLALPAGGQTTARRNAWAGMSAGSARGRDRRTAELAVTVAEQRAGTPGARSGGTGA
jgi:hypothetical protein